MLLILIRSQDFRGYLNILPFWILIYYSFNFIITSEENQRKNLYNFVSIEMPEWRPFSTVKASTSNPDEYPSKVIVKGKMTNQLLSHWDLFMPRDVFNIISLFNVLKRVKDGDISIGWILLILPYWNWIKRQQTAFLMEGKRLRSRYVGVMVSTLIKRQKECTNSGNDYCWSQDE